MNEITKQITTLRNNFDLARLQNVQQYTMTPLLNVLSLQWQADLQNITDQYQKQYLNANPSQKIVAAARIFTPDRAYVATNVALNTS